MDNLILICTILFCVTTVIPLIWMIIAIIIARLKPLKKIRIIIGDKTGVIDLESDELIVNQIERIKKGKQ